MRFRPCGRLLIQRKTSSATTEGADNQAGAQRTEERDMCSHQPPCPTPDSPDHHAAVIMSAHPEQGWSLLCNGTIFCDAGGHPRRDGGPGAPPPPPAPLAVAA